MKGKTSPTGRRVQLAACVVRCDTFNPMNLLTLTEIRRGTQNGATSARVHVQVETATPKLTREQQPYCELTLADACDRMTLRVWSDHPAYKTCSALTSQDFIELAAARSTIANSGLLQERQRFCSRDHSCSRPHALHSRRFRNIEQLKRTSAERPIAIAASLPATP